MDEHLQHMSEKIIEQASHLARVITDSQNDRYPAMIGLEDELHVARIELVKLYANSLVLNQADRVDKLKEWGRKTGTELAKHELISLDMMLREVPHYRNTIGTVMKYEALALELSPVEMYDIITTLDSAVNDVIYFFSIPFVQHEKEVLKITQSTVIELSVPIVSINERTAILPLVGTLDYDRARILEERVLKESLDLGLENLIIDLSGLQTTDTYIARQLFNLFDALSLLGIRPIVSGITPIIAQTLVHLGLSFGRIKSYATLKQALDSIE